MKKENTSIRLRQIMETRNLRQVDILERARPICLKYGIKLNKNDLSQYVSGKVEPGQKKLSILSEALGVSEAWLLGFDIPMEEPLTPALKHQEKEMLDIFCQLDNTNKKKSIAYTQNLLNIQKMDEENYLLVNAAHERTDIEITEDMRRHDEDIMNDDNF